MAVLKLTKKAVDAAQPGKKDRHLWDTEQKNFGLKITPKGRKVYVQNYRVKGIGKQKTATIGVHGSPWTLQQAREEGLAILAMASQGRCYNTEKKERRQQAEAGLGFEEYADFFAEKYLKKNWPRSCDRAISILNRHAKPFFGSKSITDITKQDCSRFIDSLSEMSATARKAAEVVGKLFRWAEDRGDIERTPMDRTPRPKPSPSRERTLSDEELLQVWKASLEMSHPYGAMIRMLALTGQRRGEVRGMLWSELDFDELLWEVPKHRTKKRRENVVPLTPLMVRELNAMPKIGSLVFTVSGETKIGNLSQLKDRLDRLIERQGEERGLSNPPHWYPHDLRRTQATGLQKLGFINSLINRVQGRKSADMGTGEPYLRYAYLKEKREALMAWDAHVAGLIGE